MKNFSTQCVMLMMIIVMVYAAPTNDPCKDKKTLLKQIRDTTKNAKHNPPNFDVYKISGSSQICVEKIFCLAYKSLQEVPKKNLNSKNHLDKLEYALEMYSKNETCELDKREQYNVKAFLDDVWKCVQYALSNNSSICHK